jgi:hypothetical protein
MYESNDPWPFKCPNCLHEFTEKIGRIQTGSQVVCNQCGTWLTDHDKQFPVALAKARNGELDPWGNMIRLKKPE